MQGAWRQFVGWIDRWPVGYQLSILVVATALPLVLATFLVFNQLAASQRDALRQNLLVAAKGLASLVDDEIETHAGIAAALASSKSLNSGDLASFRGEAEEALKFIPGSWLVLTDPNNQMVVNTLLPDGAPLPKHSGPEVVARGFAEHQFQVSDLTLGPIAQRYVSYVETPVFKDGKPYYSIAVVMAPQRFRALLDRQFTHGEVVGILDRTLRFVARVPDTGDRVGTLASAGWRDAIARAPVGISENKTLEGDATLTGYSVSRYGWTVGIGQLDAAIAAPQDRIFLLAVVGFILSIFVSLLLSLATASRFARGIRQLTASAQDLGSGLPVKPARAPFREANAIGLALAKASADLADKTATIEKGQATLEARVAERTRALEREIEKHRQTEEQLRQSQKMEAIGQLTGGIAHDFNNMLAIVMGNLDMADRRMRLGRSDVLPLLATALSGAQRAASLTRRLLAFSRQQSLSPVVMDVNIMLRSMSELLRGTLGETIQLESVEAGGLWRAYVDQGQLEQAIVNLAVNARDAMEGGGKLTVETYNAALDDDYAAAHGDVPSGQYVGIAISDTGKGMDKTTRERAFEPFFTTKDVGKGTGLGLSQVFGFVKQSGGHVKIYSELDQGTVVKIYLPRYRGPDEPAPASGTDTENTEHFGGHEAILVVEDETNVRQMLVDALRELGYQVIHADGGAQAIHVLKTVATIDLLLTDMVMPGMSGRDVAREATAIQPDIRVLYTTGYARNAMIHNGLVEADVLVLAKPFSVGQLARKVRQVFDAE